MLIIHVFVNKQMDQTYLLIYNLLPLCHAGTPQYGTTVQPGYGQQPYGQPGYQQQAYENPEYGQSPPYGQPPGKWLHGLCIIGHLPSPLQYIPRQLGSRHIA